jgi:hypothetical protein
VDQLPRCARVARRIYDALRDALQAVRVAEGSAGELAEVVRAREDARFACLSGVIETLSFQGRLAQHLDSAAVHDLLWSLTGPEMYRLLVVDRRWSVFRRGKRVLTHFRCSSSEGPRI